MKLAASARLAFAVALLSVLGTEALKQAASHGRSRTSSNATSNATWKMADVKLAAGSAKVHADAPAPAHLRAQQTRAPQVAYQARQPAAPPVAYQARQPAAPPVALQARQPAAPPVAYQARQPAAPPVAFQARQPAAPPVAYQVRQPAAPPVAFQARQPAAPPVAFQARQPAAPPVVIHPRQSNAPPVEFYARQSNVPPVVIHPRQSNAPPVEFYARQSNVPPVPPAPVVFQARQSTAAKPGTEALKTIADVRNAASSLKDLHAQQSRAATPGTVALQTGKKSADADVVAIPQEILQAGLGKVAEEWLKHMVQSRAALISPARPVVFVEHCTSTCESEFVGECYPYFGTYDLCRWQIDHQQGPLVKHGCKKGCMDTQAMLDTKVTRS